MKRVPRPCPCAFCRDRACPERSRRGGGFDFLRSKKSKSPPCRENATRVGHPALRRRTGRAHVVALRHRPPEFLSLLWRQVPAAVAEAPSPVVARPVTSQPAEQNPAQRQ